MQALVCGLATFGANIAAPFVVDAHEHIFALGGLIRAKCYSRTHPFRERRPAAPNNEWSRSVKQTARGEAVRGQRRTRRADVGLLQAVASDKESFEGSDDESGGRPTALQIQLVAGPRFGPALRRIGHPAEELLGAVSPTEAL